MKCPKCQTENPEGMRFCGHCGAKLERVCPQCNFSNPPQFRFCSDCGHDLGMPEASSPIDLIEAGEVETRIEAVVARGLTKFVGRKRKIAALKEAFAKTR